MSQDPHQPGSQPPWGPPPGPWQPPPPGPSSMSPSEERTWAGAAHWSALVAAVVALAFLGPLLVLLIKGNESPFVRRQAVEALNFQLSILIYGIVSAVLILVLVGILLLIAVGICWFVFTIIGAVRASNGQDYRYPLTLRMVS